MLCIVITWRDVSMKHNRQFLLGRKRGILILATALEFASTKVLFRMYVHVLLKENICVWTLYLSTSVSFVLPHAYCRCIHRVSPTTIEQSVTWQDIGQAKRHKKTRGKTGQLRIIQSVRYNDIISLPFGSQLDATCIVLEGKIICNVFLVYLSQVTFP